jgi:UDP-N-acetylglucosamine 2-epimerase
MNDLCRSSVDVIIANRSEVAHLAPVVKELRERNQSTVRIITIHDQESSVREMLNAIDLPPDVCWNVRGTQERQGLLLAEIYMLLNELWSTSPASWLLNYGCSRFTYPCVSAAFQNNISVAHIHDSDFSATDSKRHLRLEKIVSTISDAHFTTGLNVKNALIAEGINEKEIYSVGSTIPDFGREVLGCRILEQQVNPSFREFLDESIAHMKNAKIIAIEANVSAENLRYFNSLMTDQAEIKPDFKLIFFNKKEQILPQKVQSYESTDTTIAISLSHWESCLLFAKSFCVLSISSETIDEARSFGALGLLLKEKTKRFDLLSDGHVSLGGSDPREWLSRLKTLSEKTEKQQVFEPNTAFPRLSNLTASQQITDALTSRTDEIAQKLKT